jgi:GntR family transcriptional regulator
MQDPFRRLDLWLCYINNTCYNYAKKGGISINSLDRTLPVPLYYQLYQRLKKKIIEGQWQSEDRLPSEHDLCDTYGISRLTVRKALEELFREGHITRTRGKGTFVSEKKREENLTTLQGFTQEVLKKGQTTSSTVLDNRLIQAPPEVLQPFIISEDTPVILLKRLRYVDQLPMALEKAYINPNTSSRVLKILNMDWAHDSIYRFFQEDLGITLEYADETIEVTHPTEEDAALLKIHTQESVILRRRFTYSGQEDCIEYVISLYRADKYKFKVRLRSG